MSQTIHIYVQEYQNKKKKCIRTGKIFNIGAYKKIATPKFLMNLQTSKLTLGISFDMKLNQ
jgi:hypothetical protein